MAGEGYWPSSTPMNDAQLSTSWFELHQDNGMWSNIDINLSFVQRHNCSLKDVLRQGMLHHQVIFRNQVLQLHRLYWTQKSLMDNLYLKEFGKYAAWRSNMKPHSNEAAEEDFLMSHSSMRSSVQARSTHAVEKCTGSFSELQQDQYRSLNLNLPVDECIDDVGSECLEIRNSNANETIANDNRQELELAFGTRAYNSQKGGARRFLRHAHARDIVDNEVSAALLSNEEWNSFSSNSIKPPTVHGAVICRSQLPTLSDPISSRSIRKGSDSTPLENRSHGDHSERWQGQKSVNFNDGWNVCSSNRSMDLSAQNQHSLYKAAHFDLNTMQIEEFPLISNDPVVRFPSPSPSSTVVHGVSDDSHESIHITVTFCGEPIDRRSIETRVASQTSAEYCTPTNSGSEEANLISHDDQNLQCRRRQDSSKRNNIVDNSLNLNCEEVNPVALRSDFEGSEELQLKPVRQISSALDMGKQPSLNGESSLSPFSLYQRSNCTIASSGITPSSNMESIYLCSSLASINSPQLEARDSEPKHANHERTGNNTVSSSPYEDNVSAQPETPGTVLERQNGDAEESPCANKYNYITRHSASGTQNEDTVGHTTLSIDEDPISVTCDIVCVQDKSCSYREFRPQSHVDYKQERAREPDCLALWAAESLVNISLEISQSSINQFANNVGHIMESEEKREGPQYSSDSFESIVLRLTESVEDDCSSSLRPTEKEEGTNAGSFKLRRGRGLRDFQRDILPGLVSLCRHEICEDLHAIEAVRLHEWRKKGKAHGKSWCSTVRSRRSRLFSNRRKQ